jgi:hypothetical protein
MGYHLVCEANCGIPGVCTICLRGSHSMMEVDSMSPCVGPHSKPSISQAQVLIEENSMVVGYTIGCYELLVYY